MKLSKVGKKDATFPVNHKFLRGSAYRMEKKTKTPYSHLSTKIPAFGGRQCFPHPLRHSCKGTPRRSSGSSWVSSCGSMLKRRAGTPKASKNRICSSTRLHEPQSCQQSVQSHIGSREKAGIFSFLPVSTLQLTTEVGRRFGWELVLCSPRDVLCPRLGFAL